MSILVTGGAGYIGSHICVELLNEGYEVVIADNLSNSSIEVLERIKELGKKEVQFYKIDLLDREELDKIFLENSIEGVIHLAGYKSVNESISNPIDYYENNVSGALSLFKIMEKYKVKLLVVSSSATVYGTDNISPVTEEMYLEPINPYGRTKLMLENIAMDLYNSSKDWSISILRYFNPIGAHTSGRIGEDPKNIPNNLMPYITQVAIGKLERLSIYGDDYNTHDGTGVRDYIHVVDLAKAHVKALEKLFKNSGIGVYNIGTGKGYSVLDVVNSFEEASGIKIPYKIVDRRFGDIDISFANADKANRELGWKAEKDISQMCRDSWRWQEMNPQGIGN
nr:UDP-glucose 4-epimerase GalE [Tissierella sp.]